MNRSPILATCASFLVLASAFTWRGIAVGSQAPSDPFASLFIDARLDHAVVSVGEVVQASFSLTTPPTTTVRFPDVLALDERFDVWSRNVTSQVIEDSVRHELVVQFVVVAPGTIEFPPLAVNVRGEGRERVLTSPTLGLRVTSVLGAGAVSPSPMGTPIMVLERKWWPVIVLGSLLTLIAVVLMARRQKRAKIAARIAAQPTPVLAPHEIALAKLKELESSGRLESPDRRPAIFAMSEITREFAGAHFSCEALERTTGELLSQLQTRGVDQSAQSEIADWLGTCDLVKYAGVFVSADQAMAMLLRARQLVETLRDVPRSSAEPPGAVSA